MTPLETPLPRWWAWVVFAGFALSFGTWSLASPVASVPDEPAHVIRAAAVWGGDLVGETVALPPDPALPGVELQATEVTVPTYYARLGEIPGCYVGKPDVSADCSPTIETDGTPVRTITTAGIYTPVFYALVGWPSRLFASSAGVYSMRAISVLLCAAMLTLAVASLRRLMDIRFALLAVWVAATPMVHYLAGSVNPNGVEVAAAVAAWASALALCATALKGELDRFALAAFAGAAILMVPTRTLGPLYLLGIAATAAVFSGPRCLLDLLRRPLVWMAAGAVGLVSVASIAWTVVIDPVGNSAGSLAPENENIVVWLLGGVDDWVRQMIAVFGWLDTGPLTVVVALWLAVVVLVVALGTLGGRPWRVGGLGAVVFASLFVPVAIQSQVAADHGINWQGRYLLPLAVGVPLVGLLAAGDRSLLRRIPLSRLEAMVYSACGLALVVAHVVVMQRYVAGVVPAGQDGTYPVQNYLAVSGWVPPLPKVVMLLLAGLGAAWPAGLAFMLARDAPVVRGGRRQASSTRSVG